MSLRRSTSNTSSIAPSRDPDDDGPEASASPSLLTDGARRLAAPARPRYVGILWLACFLSATLDFTAFINMAPQTAIMEQIICKKYYSHRAPTIEPPDCKLEAIQSELAMVQEGRAALGQIPAILLALPYGIIADHYGRRTVFFLFLLGLFLSDVWVKVVYLFPDVFPLRAVWLGPFIQIIGGGGQVGDFVICTVIADVVPDQERVGAFLKLTAMDLVAQIVATPIAAAMMKASPWYPLILSSFLIVFQVLLALALPETRPQPEYQAVAQTEDDDEAISLHGDGTKKRSLLQEYRNFFASIVTISTGPVMVLLLVFSLACFGSQALQLLLQYSSLKFGWDYSEASLLMLIRSIFHLALATVLMPLIDTFIARRWNPSALLKDTTLSQLSGAFLAAGHLILFLASQPAGLVVGLITTALGSTFLVTLRSTMTSLVPATSVSALYTATSIAHALGIMAAGPLAALIFHWGMLLGDGWLGLPFLATTILHLIAIITIAYLSRRPSFRPVASAPSVS